MALLTPVDIAVAGVVGTTATPTASTGDTFANTGKEFVEIHNGSGSSMTVTIDAYPSGGQTPPGGLTVTDPTVTIPDGVTKKIGPFPKAIYNNGTGLIKVTCSIITSSTIAVFRLTPTT